MYLLWFETLNSILTLVLVCVLNLLIINACSLYSKFINNKCLKINYIICQLIILFNWLYLKYLFEFRNEKYCKYDFVMERKLF